MSTKREDFKKYVTDSCIYVIVKEEKKETNEVVNGESKTSSVKSEKIRSDRARSHRSSKSKDRAPHRPRELDRPRSGVLTFAQIKVSHWPPVLVSSDCSTSKRDVQVPKIIHF